ncbi:MAG: hypothetical protein L0271_10155 [Gemmatimonadetes bacterium]|nr:hypothetical protein [Gemmatimonadota bacterium]
MRWTGVWRALGACVIAGCGTTATAAAQAGTVDSLLAAHRRTLSLEAGRLSGEGARWLLDEMSGVQFVLIGESHNEAETPAFTAALLAALRERHGFRYLALENGPTAMEGIAAAMAAGGEAGAFEWARQYRHALQFWTDAEVEAIARVVEAEGEDGVWGLDQEWGALHVLDRLREIAPDASARALVDGTRGRVSAVEAERTSDGDRWIPEPASSGEIEALRAAFAPAAGSAADTLLGRLALSARIYGMRSGRVGYYESNDLRERSMKTEFMRRYTLARVAGDAQPRVVLKFGHWHSIRGANWGHVHSLGNFLSELAQSAGQRTFHLAVHGLNQPGRHWTLADYEDYAPIARASHIDAWTVIDLRPLRPYAAGNRLPGLTDELHRVIFGFDAVLVIGGLSPASRERLR